MIENIPEKDYKFVVGIAYKFYKKSDSSVLLEDLIQEGLIAYISMTKYYDPEKNNYFFGFAYKRVVGAMLDYISFISPNRSNTIHKTKQHTNSKVKSIYPMSEISPELSTEIVEYVELDDDFYFKKLLNFIPNLLAVHRYILYRYFIDKVSMSELSIELSCNRSKISETLKVGTKLLYDHVYSINY